MTRVRVCLLLLSACHAQAPQPYPTPPDVSVVEVGYIDGDGRVNPVCAGFVLDGQIVTAEHCLNWQARRYVYHVNGAITWFPMGDPCVWLKGDVMYFKPYMSTGPSLKLAKYWVSGESVTTIGHPYGQPYVTTRGRLLGQTTEQGNAQLEAKLRARPGNSGGPLLNVRGDVLGMAVSYRMTLSYYTPYWVIDRARAWCER